MRNRTNSVEVKTPDIEELEKVERCPNCGVSYYWMRLELEVDYGMIERANFTYPQTVQAVRMPKFSLAEYKSQNNKNLQNPTTPLKLCLAKLR